MLKESLNNRNGFSLVELLIAITVLAFVIVSVLMMTTVFINRNAFANDLTKALELAEEGIEITRRVSYTALPGERNDLQDFVDLTENFTINDRPLYAGYTREFRVDFGIDISTITVTVFWQKGGVMSSPVVLSTRRVFE